MQPPVTEQRPIEDDARHARSTGVPGPDSEPGG